MTNDLISREALNDIWELYKKYQPRLGTNVYEFGVALKDIIDNAPAVENNISETYGVAYEQGFEHGKEKYERPQGEWIITGEEQGAFGMIYKIKKCDKCGWEHSLVIPNNFCPNCGAEMSNKPVLRENE